MTIGLSVNRYLPSKNQFDERKQDWLVQKFGLRPLQRLEAIQAEPPFLLFDQEEDEGSPLLAGRN